MTEQMRQRVNQYILQIAQGDQNALDNLSRAVGSRLMAIALSVLHNRVLAEDALQESFVKVVQKAGRFSPNTNGYAWLCKIVQNQSLNLLRKEKRFKTINIEDCFDIATNDDLFQTVSNKSILADAMQNLTKIEQVVVYQKYFMDCTVRDTAKLLGKSKSTVARLVISAEQKLTAYLNGGTKPTQ